MRQGLRLSAAFGTILVTIIGQQVVVDPEPLPAKNPRPAAQTRRRMAQHPDVLYAQLVSKDQRLRQEALHSLDQSWLAERSLTDVRLFAVNLDAEDDLERVLIFMDSGLHGTALIAKQENGGWWELGTFACCGRGGSYLESFIELRETVWFGTKDIIVHSGGAQGTGVGERHLSIYRVFRGRLYSVLEIVESAYNMAGEETSQVSYPDVNSQAGPRILVVQKTKQTREHRSTQCIRYLWDPVRFAFIQSQADRSACHANL